MIKKILTKVYVLLVLYLRLKMLSLMSKKLLSFFFSLGIKDLRVVHGWRTVDFVYPSSSSREAMIRTGNHIPGKAIILDADYWQDGMNMY